MYFGRYFTFFYFAVMYLSYYLYLFYIFYSLDFMLLCILISYSFLEEKLTKIIWCIVSSCLLHSFRFC